MVEMCCEYLSVWCIWLDVLIVSSTRFRVNPQGIVAGISGTPCLKQARYLKFKWLQPQISCLFRAQRSLILRQNCRVWIHSGVCEWHDNNIAIWPVWLNGWMFNYELSGCEFELRCCHLNFRYGACFEQGVPWHSGKTIECGFTLELVLYIIRTYSQIHRTDKYS